MNELKHYIEMFSSLHTYLGESAIFTPDITKPFFHMQHRCFWKLVEHNETTMEMVAEPSPFEVGRK